MHRLQISGVNKQALAYRGAPRGCFKKRFLDVKGLVVYAVSDKKKMLQNFCPEPWIPFSVAQRLLGLLEVCNEKYKVILRN